MTTQTEPAVSLRTATPASAPPAGDEAAAVADALRPRVMGPRLSAVLGRTAPCHVLDAKYEPGLRAMVLYQHGGTLVRGDLLVPPSAEPAARGVFVAPGVRITPFPHDPDLPSLPALAHGRGIATWLADALPGSSPAGRRALRLRCRVQLLRYRPGKRATVLLSAPGAGPLIAKAYHDPAKASAVVAEAAVLAGLPTAEGLLRLAPTVAFEDSLAVVVQEAVPGSPLDRSLGGPRGRGAYCADELARTARALVELHEGAPSGRAVTARERPVSKELDRFVLRADRIASVDAHVGERLLGLAARLLAVQEALPAGPVGLVHGDCKPSQFLLDDRHVHLLDLDHCGTGDQATDAGTFLATLRQQAVRERLAAVRAGRPDPTESLATLADVFRRAYLEARALDGLAARIRWHEAVALERKALRAFARAPRSALPTALVDAGHGCLDELDRELS
ncbi:MAG: hypothetical protein K0Q93_1636 [Nocardioidaceae bacterium]|nr:hypothetical protein [Nocardioidaceae bacterium]